MDLIVCATIVRNNSVLLVKHASGQKPDYGDWILPAGRVETGESLQEALRREIKEETGMDIEIMQKLVEHVDPYIGDKIVNFLCRSTTSETKIDSELAKAKWFKLNEITELKGIHAGLKQFLTNVLRAQERER